MGSASICGYTSGTDCLAIEPAGVDFGLEDDGGAGGASGESGESGGVAGACESDPEDSGGGFPASDGFSSSSCTVSSSSASSMIGFPSGPFFGLIHRGELSDLDGRANATGVDVNERLSSIENAERLHVWRTDEAVAIRRPCHPNQLIRRLSPNFPSVRHAYKLI